MTIADEARDNAIHCEMVKYAYRQSKDGIVVSFVVHPNEVPSELSTSHIGARYMVALVQIGDDEQPIPPAEKEHRVTAAATPRRSPSQATGAKHWKDLQPAQQAGIRSNEPTFAAFLKENHPDDWRESNETAACIRLICGVHSRAQLGTEHKARVAWHTLDQEYQAWIALERVS